MDRQRRLPSIALIWFFGLTVFIAGCSSPLGGATGDNFSSRVIPITSANRNYPSIMFGGWGPHLRAPMRNSQNELWLVTDAGPDVQHNDSLIYHCFDGEHWHDVATAQQIPGIQQNVASVMSGDLIYSYGISVREPLHVEQCVFDTKTRKLVSCAPIEVNGRKLTLPPSCNYVGAAISPARKKVVWWTTVGVNGGEGKWSYIFETTESWSPPVVSTLGGFNDFGYVFASFASNDVIAIGGQLWTGAYPIGSYAVGCGEFHLGDKLQVNSNFFSLSTNAPNCGLSAADICVFEGNTHLIAETHQGTLAYYFKPARQQWPDCDKPLCILTNVHRARFIENSKSFSLVSGSANGNQLTLRQVPKRDMRHAIDWSRANCFDIPVTEKVFRQPSAIYVESRSYQTAPVRGANFCVVGHYPEADSHILSVIGR